MLYLIPIAIDLTKCFFQWKRWPWCWIKLEMLMIFISGIINVNIQKNTVCTNKISVLFFPKLRHFLFFIYIFFVGEGGECLLLPLYLSLLLSTVYCSWFQIQGKISTTALSLCTWKFVCSMLRSLDVGWTYCLIAQNFIFDWSI